MFVCNIEVTSRWALRFREGHGEGVAQHAATARDEGGHAWSLVRVKGRWPRRIFATVTETCVSRYSDGVVHSVGMERTTSTARRMLSLFAPARMLLPASCVSALSVTSRRVTIGTWKMLHSS